MVGVESYNPIRIIDLRGTHHATDGDIEFLSELHYRDFGRYLWYTTAPFTFVAEGQLYEIATYFVLDFFSVPFPLNAVFPRNQGQYNESALIHDWTVRNRKLLGLSLMDCHRIFLKSMRYQGVGRIRRGLKYSAVVGFNWAVAGKGDGTPSRRARRAIRRVEEKTGISYHQLHGGV